MRLILHFPADLVKFTEEIFNEKLQFLCRVTHSVSTFYLQFCTEHYAYELQFISIDSVFQTLSSTCLSTVSKVLLISNSNRHLGWSFDVKVFLVRTFAANACSVVLLLCRQAACVVGIFSFKRSIMRYFIHIPRIFLSMESTVIVLRFEIGPFFLPGFGQHYCIQNQLDWSILSCSGLKIIPLQSGYKLYPDCFQIIQQLFHHNLR